MKRVATSHTLVRNDPAEPWIWRGERYIGRGKTTARSMRFQRICSGRGDPMRSPAKLRDAIFEIRNGGTWNVSRHSMAARKALVGPLDSRPNSDISLTTCQPAGLSMNPTIDRGVLKPTVGRHVAVCSFNRRQSCVN